MAYIHIENFKKGLDRRGEQLNGEPGTLWEAVNGHFTRKGEFERRKKFVAHKSLPAGQTFGYHIVNGTQYVFGSAASPSVPSGITYQRLQHPDGSTAMSAVLDAESYGGRPYVTARFADGDVYHFNNGVLVEDFYAGIVRDDMTNNDGIAEHLKALIDADDDFGATRSGAVVTVTGPVGDSFTISTTTEDGGGTDNQTAVVAQTQASIASISEVLATATFNVTGGSANTAATGTVELTGGAAGSVDGITVNGVQIMSSAVAFNSSLSQTATDVAANITAHTSSPNYTATADGAVITISAAQSVGADANGFVVVSSATTITTSDTNMASGVTNAVTSITVNGVEVLSTRVNWTVSNAGTATNVASQINNYTSSPEYSATASGNTVTISAAAGSGAGPNGSAVVVSVAGDATASTPTAMAGGVTAVTGQAQINTVTIGGTFEAGDKFNVQIVHDGVTKNFGYVGNPTGAGTHLLVLKKKMHTIFEGLLEFAGVGNASHWNRDDQVTAPGANFIDMSTEDEGAQTLTALAKYQGNLAVFARNVILIWSIDPDEDLNVLLQPVTNTGTRSPNSALNYGNNDTFYLADSGLRSLRARDSSNAAYVSDVGVPIDPFILAHMATLTDARIEAAYAVLDPEGDRFWLALGGRIYVFSFFPGADIAAWSYYDTTDDIGADIQVLQRSEGRVYARAGDTIYLYGGANNDTYPGADEIEAVLETPFLDANMAGTEKNFEGIDSACTNEWTVTAKVNPSNTADVAQVGIIQGPTYGKGSVPFTQSTTHVALRMVCGKAGAASVSDIIIHYEDPNVAE